MLLEERQIVRRVLKLETRWPTLIMTEAKLENKEEFEVCVFGLIDPTPLRWEKFKSLQPQVNEISERSGLSTKSVTFDEEHFRSIVMLKIPHENMLTNAAIEVCKLYAKEQISHTILSRTGGEAMSVIQTMRRCINTPFRKGYKKAKESPE